MIASYILTVIAYFLITVKSSAGIRCWVCDGKNSLEECHSQHGAMLTCPNPDDVCQNDFRTARGTPIITKGCKQAMACKTEVQQNKDKNQCGRKTRNKNMVCRCCCTSDGCNAKASGCLPPPAPCKRLKNPVNGQSFCPREIDFGSSCTMRCRQGYRRIGAQRAVCVRTSKGSKTGIWRPGKPIICERIIVKCNPAREAPENGFITCDNSKEYRSFAEKNFEGTKCVYDCRKNYYLKGKKNAMCTNSGNWNNEEPTCVKGECDNNEADPNRIETCTDGYHFGSKCKFSCKKGYNMIGDAESSCQQSGPSARGYWSKKFPKCAEVLCFPELTNPANGKVSCTENNVKNSVCTYSCDEGYDLDDSNEKTASVVCRDNNDGTALGKWSKPPSTCSKIRCEPSFKDPYGGQVVCSDGNMYGSECSFSCDNDHDLVGTTNPTWVSKCEDDGNGDAIGKWSEAAADCKSITCEPEFVADRREKISCTKKNGRNSVCTFSCEEDYVLDGTTTRFVTSECIAPKDGTAIGRWSRIDKPGCIPVTCTRLDFPQNGFRICSTSFNIRGTFCVFYCGDGYDRIGQSYTSCLQGKEGSAEGEWSSPPPTCRLGQCSVPKFDKENVVEECNPPKGFPTSEYRVGTVCKYKCKSEAYYMVSNVGFDTILTGEVTSRCNTEKKWTALAPRCLLKTCLPQLTPPPYGYPPKCTNGNIFGSKCTFSCQEKHAPTNERPLVCEDDGDNDPHGRWSEEPPTCKRSHCDEFGTVINGKLNCSDGTKIGSVCALECIHRYTTKRYDDTECLPTADWSRRKYFCCVPCLFNRRVKIATALDRNAIKNENDWRLVTDFTKSYLTLMLQHRLDVFFSAFTYAEDVDLDTEIPMTRLRSVKDVDPIVEKLEQMRYGGDDSSTGEALEYINEVVYERWDRWREQFALLVTDGRSSDNVIGISQKMRQRGIGILATGINVDRAGKRQLLQITGTENNVFITKQLEDMKHVPAKIFEISRTTGCTAASKTQTCP